MRHKIVTAAILSLFLLAAVAGPIARQQQVAPAMPFNVHSTTHVFQENQAGGIQQIVAKDPNDKALVAAIRSYLEAEAQRFGNGDYSGRFKGVRNLKAVKPSQIAITYRNVPAGAAIDYVGADAAAVDAIHKWLDAEIPDQE